MLLDEAQLTGPLFITQLRSNVLTAPWNNNTADKCGFLGYLVLHCWRVKRKTEHNTRRRTRGKHYFQMTFILKNAPSKNGKRAEASTTKPSSLRARKMWSMPSLQHVTVCERVIARACTERDERAHRAARWTLREMQKHALQYWDCNHSQAP